MPTITAEALEAAVPFTSPFSDTKAYANGYSINAAAGTITATGETWNIFDVSTQGGKVYLVAEAVHAASAVANVAVSRELLLVELAADYSTWDSAKCAFGAVRLGHEDALYSSYTDITLLELSEQGIILSVHGSA